MTDAPVPAGGVAVVGGLTPEGLQGPVRALLADPAAAVLTHHARSIYTPFTSFTAGVYRVTGAARLGDGAQTAWSLVLKVVRSPAGLADDALGPAREVLAYGSGLLDALDGVRAPQCYGIDDPGDGYARLWLEDLGDQPADGWSLDDYRTAARAFGRLAGAAAAGRPLPAHGWLDRAGVRAARAQEDRQFARLPAVRDHPLVRRGVPDDLLARQVALRAARDPLDAALVRLPQTLCHHDATTRNVVVRRRADGAAETVAFDWAMVGVGPLGRDLGQLVPSGVHRRDVDPQRLPEVDAAAFPAYLGGLRAAGWDGDAALARFGYCACGAIRYGLTLVAVDAVEAGFREQVERAFDLPIEALLDLLVAEQRFLMDLGEEALALLPAVLRA
jgi:hypothetical protein